MIVKYKKKNILSVSENLRLLPGVNYHVDEKEFAAAQELYPRINELIEEGTLEVVGASVANEVEQATDDEGEDSEPSRFTLAGLSAKEAIALVNETADLEALQDLLETEDRATVKKALSARIKKIEEALKPDPKAEGDDEGEDSEPVQGELGGEVIQ